MSDVEPEPEDMSLEELQSFLGSISPEPEPFSGEMHGEFIPDTPMPDDESPLFGDISKPVGDGECDVCGAPTFRPPGLTQAGRKKRVPRRCDLHARKPGVSSEGPIFAGVESQLKRVQEELADDLRLLGTLAGPLFPVTGYYIIEHADPFTIAVLKLAKNNTRVLRVLHRAASIAPIYTVAECVGGTAYAFQVDTRKADPHNVVGQRLGVSRVYDAIYPEEAQVKVENNGFAPPPHYGVGVQ